MTPGYALLLSRHLPDCAPAEHGEAVLLPSLLRWLLATGRVRSRTRVAYEVPLLGRRVDLALVTGRGVTSAFELKIGRLQRVLEQAAYNRASFHRSWIVTGNRPKAEGLRWADELGIGVLVVQNGGVRRLATPAVQNPHPAAVARLQAAIVARAEVVI